jgi:hypothetical protein
MKLRSYRGGGTGGYGSTIAFWAWAVVRVGRVLGSCTGADHESLIVWRGYQQKLPGAKFSRSMYCGTGQHNPNSKKSSLFIILVFIWNNNKKECTSFWNKYGRLYGASLR